MCRHQLSSAEARVGELEEELARCDAELARYTGDLATTQCVIGQLTEHNRHLQDELKRLQERSALLLLIISDNFLISSCL